MVSKSVVLRAEGSDSCITPEMKTEEGKIPISMKILTLCNKQVTVHFANVIFNWLVYVKVGLI